MAFLAAVGTFLHDRIWLSKKSSILGLLVFAAGELLSYLGALPNMPASVHLIVSLIAAPFLLWKDQAVKDGTIKLVALILFLSAGAFAAPNPEAVKQAVESDPNAVQPGADVPPPTPPRIGGCLKNGKLCFGPTVSLSLAAINLSKKTIEGSFSPGVGLGVTYNPGLWNSVGVDMYLNLDPGAQSASFAVLLKVLGGYARVGWSKGFIGENSRRVLFGTGFDL